MKLGFLGRNGAQSWSARSESSQHYSACKPSKLTSAVSIGYAPARKPFDAVPDSGIALARPHPTQAEVA